MTTYAVVWTPQAEDELAAIWVAAADRQAVTDATHRLEQQLAQNPLGTGESRDSSVHRVKMVPPIGIDFDVIEDDKRVLVQAVWATG